MFQSAHLKGIAPPHMVPETTALSTELQVRTTFEKDFSNLDKIYSNIFTLTCKVIFLLGALRGAFTPRSFFKPLPDQKIHF